MPKRTKAVKKTNKDHAWNRRNLSKKTYAKSILPQKSFLIICEGENTEPEYFKSFPLGNAQVETYGLGRSKSALIEHIIAIVLKRDDAHMQEVWAVFDFDTNPAHLSAQRADFEKAVALAKKHHIHAAWSNDCFELWLVLHFQFVEAELTRGAYYTILSGFWNCNYAKSGKNRDFAQSVYGRLQEDARSNQQNAIDGAVRLERNHAHLKITDKNPGTTVHHLVRELNRYL